MMKILLSLFSFLAICVTAYAQPTAQLIGAPDVIPPATEAMQHPEFWISRIKGDADRVIMTPGEIAGLNKRNAVRPLTHEDINGNTVTIDSVLTIGNFSGIRYHMDDPLEISVFSGDVIRHEIEKSVDGLMKANYWDRRRIRYPEWKKRELAESMQPEAVSDVVRPRHGVIVHHTLVRGIPTSDRVYASQYNWLDMFQLAVLETGQAVAVLHETRNRDWLYVRSEYVTGWVPALNVAFGQPREIRRFYSPDSFVVAVCHKVPVYNDIACVSYLTDIYMGARLPFDKKTPAGYVVHVPVRRPDGTLGDEYGWIEPDAGVNVGYQPYTQRNIITTFFRLLNRPYGWGGMDHERDCVGTVRAVFRTFGINMPRWTTFELYSADKVITFPADTPKDLKYRFLSECDPGITVCGFNWHVVLYLGEVDGVHYVIHQNGYSYHGDDGTEYRVGRVSVNSTELEGGADIARWTELSVFKP